MTTSSASGPRPSGCRPPRATKIEAKRAHMQSFVDRFRAKASKARQAQSRLKMLAKLPPASTCRGGVDRAASSSPPRPGRWRRRC